MTKKDKKEKHCITNCTKLSVKLFTKFLNKCKCIHEKTVYFDIISEKMY